LKESPHFDRPWKGLFSTVSMEMSNASVACSQIPVLLGDEGLIKKIRKSFLFLPFD